MRHPYADFLGDVEKPSRYVGGEYQQVRKDPARALRNLAPLTIRVTPSQPAAMGHRYDQDPRK